jgi:hypothetical protein
MENLKNIQKLKDLINKNKDLLFSKFPKKDSKEFLFISKDLKNLYYFLFDLEDLKLDCMHPTCKFDFYILAQVDNDQKIYNYTQVIGDYEKIYFYPFIKEVLSEFDSENIIDKAFIDFKKNSEII